MLTAKFLLLSFDNPHLIFSVVKKSVLLLFAISVLKIRHLNQIYIIIWKNFIHLKYQVTFRRKRPQNGALR